MLRREQKENIKLHRSSRMPASDEDSSFFLNLDLFFLPNCGEDQETEIFVTFD
jgi:hypothetical protein